MTGFSSIAGHHRVEWQTAVAGDVMLWIHLCFGLFFFGGPSQPAITYHPLRTPMAIHATGFSLGPVVELPRMRVAQLAV